MPLIIIFLFLQQDDVYMTPIATASLTKSSRKPKPKGEDEHKYEYIDPLRFPVMRFAILANENETIIHSYRWWTGDRLILTMRSLFVWTLKETDSLKANCFDILQNVYENVRWK